MLPLYIPLLLELLTIAFRMPAESPKSFMAESAKVVSLARGLKTQLENVMPSDFHVEIGKDGLGLFYKGNEDVWLGRDLWNEADTDQENVQRFVTSVLSGIQDVITLNTKETWPQKKIAESQTNTDLPLLDSRWDGQKLNVWFGSETDPVLRLTPVHLK